MADDNAPVPSPAFIAEILAATPPGPQPPLPPPLIPPESGPRYVIVEPGVAVTRDERGDLNTGGVLGGAVSDRNAYIAAYPRIHDGHKPVRELAIGERTQATYSLSGSRGTYDIVRVS
jgi:hypothetical protein